MRDKELQFFINGKWSLFPGVYTELVDNTIAIASTPASVGFIVFMSEKGPDNQLELYSRTDQLLSTFGNIDVTSYGQGLKVAIQYLTYATSLYCIRVTPDHTNCAAMSNIYHNLYGKFIKSAIEMREAAYANIGVATNENGEFEFIHVGPENLGTIISTTTLVPPTTPRLNDRYYIPSTPDATGTWKGHEGEVAICISEDPVVWAYKEVRDTSVATINGILMCAAVVYEQLPSLALWRPYENTYNASGKSAGVLDIIDELPTDQPEDGDAYLICNNPIDPRFGGHRNQVITYRADMDEWYFESYNKVFVERDYILTDEAPMSLSDGDRFIIGDTPITPEWVGHEREIAVRVGTTWKFMQIDVAEPEETDKFQSIVLDQYISATEPTKRIEYKRKNVFVKDVTWTSDINASFVAYAHRMIQFDDIVNNAKPDESITHETIEPFVIFYPIGRGEYYNNLHVDMRMSKRSIHETSDFNKLMILDIYDTSGGNKLKVESYEVSFNPNRKDLSGNSVFIKDILERYSNYLRCAINREIFNEDALFTQNIHSDLELLFQRYSLRNRAGTTSLPPNLEHGDDGTIFDKYGNLDWEQATSILVKAYTGQIINPASEDQANPYEGDVLDTENKLFDLIFDAGYPEDVKVAINTLIEARHQDCFGIIDLGDNASAKAAYEARTQGLGIHFNTPFIAIYEPYSLVYDAYSGRDIWISPVYHAARAYALTDKNYGKHHAPAGTRRGQCPEVKKLRYNLNRETAYQDLFMNYNINPIIQNRDGFVIWNQSTSQLRTSKYQDINGATRSIVKSYSLS